MEVDVAEVLVLELVEVVAVEDELVLDEVDEVVVVAVLLLEVVSG